MLAIAKFLGGPLAAYNLLNGDRDWTLTSGCFDVCHVGHIRMLNAAKKAGGNRPLIVAVNSDASIRRLKGRKRPILPLRERIYTLTQLSVVDGVLYFDDDRVSAVIELLRPKFWVKGAGYTKKTLDSGEVRAAKRAGTKIIILSSCGSWSTTSILKKI